MAAQDGEQQGGRDPVWVTTHSQAWAGAGSAELVHAAMITWPDQFPSASSARRALRRRLLTLNGEPAAAQMTLETGDVLGVRARRPRPAQTALPLAPAAVAAAASVRVLWQDDELACVVKPQGLATRGTVNGAPSLAACLPAVLGAAGTLGTLRRPAPVHRLDAATGGLVLVAKTHAALTRLSAAFAERAVRKRYVALVWGAVEGGGELDAALDGKPALTEYACARITWAEECLERRDAPGSDACLATDACPGTEFGTGTDACPGTEFGMGTCPQPRHARQAGESRDGRHLRGDSGPNDSGMPAVTTLDLWPHTGRMHQLRRHLALARHPIVGDAKYTAGYADRAGAQSAAGSKSPDVTNAAPQPEQERAETVTRQPASHQHTPPLRPVNPAAAATAAQALDPGLCLWSVGLELAHPSTGEPLQFSIPEPEELVRAREQIAAAWRSAKAT